MSKPEKFYTDDPDPGPVNLMTELTLAQANELISGVFTQAQQRNMPALAVAVLDSGGHIKALQRQDGVSFLRPRIAEAKAWGALALAADSDTLAERYQRDELQRGFINALNSMTEGRLIPLPGGVLIHDEQGSIIGAIGAAGGESSDDEACVRNSIEQCGFFL